MSGFSNKLVRIVGSGLLSAGLCFSLGQAALASETQGFEVNNSFELEISAADMEPEVPNASESHGNHMGPVDGEDETVPSATNKDSDLGKGEPSSDALTSPSITPSDDELNSGSESSSGAASDDSDIPDKIVEPDQPSAPSASADGWGVSDSGDRVYYEGGALATGERLIDGEWYHFDESTGALSLGWLELKSSGGKWVYYDPSTGAMVKGESYNPCGNEEGDASFWYYFDPYTGATSYGWRHLESSGGKWVYYAPYTGTMVKGESYNPSGNAEGDGYHWYLFDEGTGAASYGWKWLNTGSKWVYYDEVCAWMLYGEQLKPSSVSDPSTHWYYFDDTTGAATHGWRYVQSGSKWCYYDDAMAWMLYGTHLIEGKLRVFNQYTGACSKIGYQNDPRYFQVGSWNVSVPGSGIFGYATPSQISVDASREDCVEAMIGRAYNYLSTPYIWDYSSWPGVGVDCAGLVMQCLYAAGMDLSPFTPYDHYYTPGHDHYANDMWETDRFMHVDWSNRQRGDLICYPGHIAIYLGDDTIIEAVNPSVGVRIASVYAWSSIKGAIRPFN